MILSVYVNDTLYSDGVIAESLSIEQDISDRISTLELTFKRVGGPTIARWDEATWDNAVFGVDVAELYDIRVEDGSGNRYFGGQIVRIEYERKSATLTLLKCNATDYTVILDRVLVVAAQFTGQTDRTILQSLISTYAPSITSLTANIASTTTIPYFEVKEQTLREAIEDLCELTGAEWRVDYSKNFLYFLPTTYPAPFGLSSSPNGTTTFGIDAFAGHTRDAIRLINSCTVLGGFLPGGVEISVTYENPVSILEYGRQAHTIVDRDITVAAVAMLRAQAIVNERAYPEESFTLSTTRDGLSVGQSLPVLHGDFQVDGNYIIRSLRMKQRSKTITQYEIDLGAKPPDQLRLLRQIEARSRRSTQVPVALAADGSVTTDSIGLGGLNASVLIGTITGGNVAVNAANLFGTITGDAVTVNAAVIAGTISGVDVVVDAGTIQGVITGDNVAVDVTTFQGAIISSQVADDLINRLSLYADALRPIASVDSFPTLPSPDYPDGSFIYLIDDGEFYRNDAGTWTEVSESAAVNGKLEFYHIGTIKAPSIIGLIAAAQIDEITAGQISGSITASQIGSVFVSALTGTLTTGDVARIDIGVVQGNLDVSRIDNLATIAISSFAGNLNVSRITSLDTVSISSFTGNLDVSRVANLNTISISSFSGNLDVSRVANLGTISISTFSGNLDVSRVNNLGTLSISSFSGNLDISRVNNINTINLGSLSGTVSAGQIGSINAATITIGLVQDSQINTISAGKLTAGTITASVSMTAPTLTVTSGSVTVNIDSTNIIKVTNAGFNRYSSLSAGHLDVTSTADSNRFANVTVGTAGGNVTVQDSGFNRMDLTPTGLRFALTKVVGAQGAAVASPSGGATIDVECRAQLSLLLSRLRASTGHGLIA